MVCDIVILFLHIQLTLDLLRTRFLSFLVLQDGAGSETVLLLFHTRPDFAVCFLVIVTWFLLLLLLLFMVSFLRRT